RGDCASRRAELLMSEDQDELDFLKKIIGKPSSYFWIGLSFSSTVKAWTWLNGSRLDLNRFRLTTGYEDTCGALRGKSISSAHCSTPCQWICQKEATQL
ncbi:KLRB1 protein, partial [Columbina picui]|nr:KLRB1 protein [Columbina picui]